MPHPLTYSTPWTELRDTPAFWQDLEQHVLPPYVNTCRWFAGKARHQTGFRAGSIFEFPARDSVAYILILEALYSDGPPEQYLLPLSFVTHDQHDSPEIPAKGIVTVMHLDGVRGLLVDGIYDERFRASLYKHIAEQKNRTVDGGKLVFQRGRGLDAEDVHATVSSRVLPVDSSNSAMVFADKYFFKFYRKLFELTNPEVDMVAFITENSDFANIPAYAGSVTYAAGTTDITLGMMQRMVANEKDSWSQTGDYLNDFLYAVPKRQFAIREDVFDKVELLAKRTAEMHLALYAPDSDPAFAPEPFTEEYRNFLIHRFTDLLDRRYALLVDNYNKLDAIGQKLAWVFMEAREMIEAFVEEFRTRPLESLRIRIHGDYHLGQVLATRDDFIIIDFEGEPESSIADRKIKHSPLKDVAGMIRSYHYAVCAKIYYSAETETLAPDHLQRVSDRWFRLIRETYQDAYLDRIGMPHPLFRNNNEINFLLLVYLLEKAVYELGYEISYRPAWVKIPLKGIIDVIREIEKIRISDHGLNDGVPMLQTSIL
ncbi:putative maltokinase [Arsenicibacter rosenii]|uniref:Maltokinase n=1 Tax=Arsenicibacter rosenii TaxID=1750698 RepID=A0A1S2VM93_9BACT|nr:putative maltokinase [Arsenicibacter rosenii]OIN59500.1 trehalose synthase [Arsenicibacter rosenii]